MWTVIEHPFVLVLTIVACAPLLWPLARFFFADLDSFLRDAGLSRDTDRWLWLFGFPRLDWYLKFKIIGYVGSFGILVMLLYITICRTLF